MRLISARNELPSEWHNFFSPLVGTVSSIEFLSTKDFFPYIAASGNIAIEGIKVYLKANENPGSAKFSVTLSYGESINIDLRPIWLILF